MYPISYPISLPETTSLGSGDMSEFALPPGWLSWLFCLKHTGYDDKEQWDVEEVYERG